MFPLDDHPRADRLRSTLNDAALVFLRTRRQQQVQLLQIPHLLHRYQMVPPELAPFAFYATLFMPFAWRAKLRLESPVRAESNEPRRLLPLMTPQDFLYGALQVVVTQHAEHTAEIGERQFVRFQKRLLVGVRIRPMKCAPAGHTAQAEHVRLAQLAVELHPAFIPVQLRLAAPGVGLWHE